MIKRESKQGKVTGLMFPVNITNIKPRMFKHSYMSGEIISGLFILFLWVFAVKNFIFFVHRVMIYFFLSFF